MFVSAIVLASGRGTRLGRSVSKPLLKINGLPLLAYSLGVFDTHPAVKEIVITVNPENVEGIRALLQKLQCRKVRQLTEGGARRQDSVRRGLSAVSRNADLVLIHDAARPFIDRRIVSAVIREAGKTGAAVVAVPVKSTIKTAVRRSSGRCPVVERTIDRRCLWEIQTPQVFKAATVTEAFRRFGAHDVTDDSMLVEKMGVKVSIVEGEYRNIKVTTPEDVVIAEALARPPAVDRPRSIEKVWRKPKASR